MQYKDNGDLFVSQSKYVKELFQKPGIENCKPALTLSKPYTQLLMFEGEPLFDLSFYRSLARVLRYLTFTRLDLAHSFNIMCQYMTNPTDTHMFLDKRILRYLKRTIECGITYSLLLVLIFQPI